MVVRKLGHGWAYDMRLLGKRWRKGRFRTKGEALMAEKQRREELLSGKTLMTFRQAYEAYVSAIRSRVSPTTLEGYAVFFDRNIAPAIGHLMLAEVSTHALDQLKQALPANLGPKSINQRLILVRAVLRHAWKRGWLAHQPFVPMESVPKKHVEWYEVDERDRFLQGMFELAPQWYFFFLITARCGLRRGEVYAMQHEQLMFDRQQIVIDRAAIVGTKDRPAEVRPHRKGRDTLVLNVTTDIASAYEWHCKQGYAGKRFVFLADDQLPKDLNSHAWAMELVIKKLGLRRLTHHKIGRHSVGSQADAIGATAKAIQRQLGHQSAKSTDQYVHGSSKAQRAIVEALRPARAPHEPPPENELN